MKRTTLSLAMIMALGALSSSAFAASTGTITFNGQLTDTTCEVDVNGQGSDAIVTLPTISINQLTENKTVDGRTSFNLNVSNCTIGTANGKSKVAAFFQAGDTVDLTSGRLNNTAGEGAATNVQLQLLDASNKFAAINVGNTDQVNNMAYIDIKTAGEGQTGRATLPYAVEYYALGQTTPGVVTSKVVYNLQYK